MKELKRWQKGNKELRVVEYDNGTIELQIINNKAGADINKNITYSFGNRKGIKNTVMNFHFPNTKAILEMEF